MSKLFFKRLVVLLLFCLTSIGYSKEITIETFAQSSDLTSEMNEELILSLNGFRQSVTAELIELKLDSEVFWKKIEQKKLSPKEEYLYLKNMFENIVVMIAVNPIDKVQSPAGDTKKLNGTLKAILDSEKCKALYFELVSEFGDMKIKTFYLLPNIELDDSIHWEDLGVSKAESFRGAVISSWKQLFDKEIKGFEKVILLEKDFNQKFETMNAKSAMLKWTSTFKKVAFNNDNQTMTYELSAQYVLLNPKSGIVMQSFDFPTQKRELNTQNKKALSSSLASLVYNLLLSQMSKINSALENNALGSELKELEIKIISKVGLSEVYQLNNFLQERFKSLKLTSQMKTYSSLGSTILIRAEASEEKILSSLAANGEKIPLNEQKVLLFNPADKTFAILPKESNN